MSAARRTNVRSWVSAIALISCGRTAGLLDGAQGGGPAEGSGTSPTSHGASNVSASNTSGDAGTSGSGNTHLGTSSTGVTLCDRDPDADVDQDGFTPSGGDCDDCNARINPGAIEVPTMNGEHQVDEDCNGRIDDVASPCDANLLLESTSPIDAAKAIEICRVAQKEGDFGLLSAAFVRADGKPTAASVQTGIMEAFGAARPRAGTRLFVMSTGNARTPDQGDACNSDSCQHGPGVAPPGYPSEVPGCPHASTISDDVGLEVKMRAPTNADGYGFDHKLYSFEFPEWVCTDSSDELFVMALPAPQGAGANGNLVFDAEHNPSSANLRFFDVCSPDLRDDYASQCMGTCPKPQDPYCHLGIGDLSGTGFGRWGNAGATRWLRTEASVTPGSEVTLRFAIFDGGEGRLDSTILIDQFEWITDHVVGDVTTDVAD